jgi:hypothetical protein
LHTPDWVRLASWATSERTSASGARRRLRRRLARLTTWAGEWRARHYKDLPGQVGVDIELEFIPNDKVDAKLIGMVQTAMSQSGGKAPFRDPAVDPEWGQRSIDPGPNLGLGIDQLAGFIDPLYITTQGAKGDTLTSTGTLGPDTPGGGRGGRARSAGAEGGGFGGGLPVRRPAGRL